ncbi:hypothetical protein AB0G82_37485 [Streptomyces anulatus]|uniref:hypothetical protein n=1 Tax=Streptomyces anulatus TaxID=1892 RepID=UPI0033EEC2F4
MTTTDSTPMPDPATPAPAGVPVPSVLAPWATPVLAVGMFALVPIALVLFVMDRPHMREAMDATGSFLGGVGTWGALLLCALQAAQAYRERRSP